ncbi:class I SAM-dependent methyltransferase [Leifsonia sp. YAF41]|uniref:class I SAM-dependent DNA methyltransferase n=1 Tax=Leifsonia sp. YAF41 TaxID=3233086 RepID=UPI003F97D81C
MAESYAQLLADTAYESPLDLAMVRHFVAELGETSGARLLDAGCGAGRMITFIDAIASFDIEGVDVSSRMVELAQRAHPARRFSIADLKDLPYENAHFDGVLAWYSIIHTPTVELASVLSELHRVLRPGGYALFGFHVGTGERIIRHAYGHDVTLQSQLYDDIAVQDALEDVGFTVAARLRRGPRATEAYPQAFLLARRPL